MEKLKFPEKNSEQAEKIKELELIISRACDSDEGVQILHDFAKKLQNKYPDYLNYRLYHLVIGSSCKKPPLKFDFPGEDSVENFLKSQNF